MSTVSDTKDSACYRDLGVGMLGNVDSGKSSTLGQLTTGGKDDGNGKLRSLISRHPHEIRSGRTSDVVHHSAIFGKNRITFADLAGHEKYLKTTIVGLSTMIPDLLILCVDRYASTYKMTREHMGLAIRMGIPFVIVFTKTDLYEKEITDTSLTLISKVIKKASSRTVIEVNSQKTLDDVISQYQYLGIVPAFRISNVSHDGVPMLREFLSRIDKYKSPRFVHAKHFMVDRCYRVKGIGMVVSGYNGGSSISTGEKLILNTGSGHTEVYVRSIHDDFRKECKILPEGARGCLAIRSSVDWIRSGSVISKTPLTLVKKFAAEIEILSSHSTSIKNGYRTLIHCGPVRRASTVVADQEMVLRGGMKSKIIFCFENPAWVEIGQAIFFREGRIIGDGCISQILD